jgi:hypothetical protein
MKLWILLHTTNAFRYILYNAKIKTLAADVERLKTTKHRPHYKKANEHTEKCPSPNLYVFKRATVCSIGKEFNK